MGPDAIVAALRARGWTLATAESLTAGLVAATIADVPGCSDVLRGGVVAYDVQVKAGVLGIPADLLAQGVVSEQVARAMARAARTVVGADVGVGTTGVAGPEPHGGEPVGSVWIAVATAEREVARHLQCTGDRAQVRAESVRACWSLILQACEDGAARPED